MATKKSKPATASTTTKPATASTTTKLERHPLSEKYGPPLSQEEMLGLATDIERHGQHDPIITFEGKVLAGWNRYMACLQKGITPKFQEYAGNNPEAVAFGTNVVRRRMSSVQKAFLGAQFCIDTNAKQTDVAKMCAVSLNRLNQCCQLLKADTPESKRAIASVRENPEMSGAAFEELVLECGIGKRKPVDDDDLFDPSGSSDDDDLTGGAIDALLDGNTPDSETKAPASRKKGLDNDDPLPSVGSKPGKMTNPHETQVSRVAKAFKSLTADEQRQFVRFTWGKLQPALDAAIAAMEVDYAAKKATPTKKTKAADNGIADIADALTGKKKAPARK